MSLDKLRIAGALTNKLLVGPKTVYLDINTDCNIACDYCWIHSPLNKEKLYPRSRRLELNEIKKIIDSAKQWYSEEIVISGDGEPTIHPDFKAIIEYIHIQKLRILLTTNCTFSKELLPTIAKIDYLYITFSAPEKTLYEKIQSPDNHQNFDRVIKNLTFLARLNKKYQKPFVNIAYIINTINFTALPKMLSLAETLGINKITFRIMEPTKYTKPHALSKTNKSALIKIIDTTLKNDFRFSHNLADIHSGLTEHKKSPYHLRQCFTGWFNIFVDFNKNVGICCHNENLVVGNLTKNSFEAIWQSKKAHKVRLHCKHNFDLKIAPFKGECEWCHWHNENNKICNEIKKLQNV